MARHTKIINLSLPSSVYDDVDELARQKGVSRSHLLREALKQYVASDKRWRQIYERGAESATQLGVRDEAEIDRLVHEYRAEQSKT